MKTKQKNKKIKKRYVILSIFLGIALTLLIGCFYTLTKGIGIAHLKIANIELQGLYLKLNNKLNLTLDNLKMIKQNKQTHIEVPKVIQWFQKSLIAISYFEKIEIKNIILPDTQTASVFYNGEQYILNFPELQAIFQIQQSDQKINLKIQKLLAQRFKTQVSGQIDYLVTQGKIDFSLTAYAIEPKLKQDEKLIIKGNSNLKILNLSAFSTPIASLDLYEEEIKKIPALHEWLIEKSSFGSARIKNLFFSAPLDENFVPRMLKSLYAELDLENVKLKLEPDISPIIAPFLKIKFQKEILSFDLQNPVYEQIPLDGSSVELHNLSVPHMPTQTLVYLKSKEAMLDERVHKILKAYDVDFDVHQLDSSVALDLKLAFQKNPNGELDVEAKGKLKSHNTNLLLFGMPVFLQDLNVILDLDPEKSRIFVQDSRVKVEKPLIEGLVNCDIDLKQQKVYGTLNSHTIQINTSTNPQSPFEKILNITQENPTQLTIDANYGETSNINIPEYEIQITLDSSKKITLNNLSKIYPYSPLLQHLDIRNGEVFIDTKDFENFAIKTKLSDLNYPIFDKKWNPIKKLEADINITPKNIHIQSLDNNIAIDYANDSLKAILKNKNFDLEKLQNNTIPLFDFKDSLSLDSQNTTNHSSKKTKNTFSLYLESMNSDFRYKNYIIPTDEVIVNLRDEKITLDATHKNGVMNLDFYDNIVKFNANNFSGNFINIIAEKELVKGGLFSGKGLYKNKTLKANIEIQNTIFKNFATLQNIVALIDTVPSLVVFKKPGFSTQGYQVNQGRISLELNNQYLGLKKIDLVGDSIDISGGGIIALDTQELNISLTISTIKGLSEVLNKIPIVGYLLLGKEGKISTSLILKGTLQNPKTEITLAQDILSAPFKIIERIFIPE